MNGKLTTIAVIIISFFITALDLVLFEGMNYNAVSIILAILACMPYCASHGKRMAVTKELWIIILFTFFSSSIIILCSVFTFFRPFTFLTITAGMYFGTPVGYFCGVFSALFSSAFSGIGGWTIYQLTVLGIIGFIAGMLNKKISENNLTLVIFSALSSFLFSSVNILHLIWNAEKGFDFSSYLSLLINSLKWFAVYCISDVLVMLLLKKLFGKKLERIKRRFRIFKYR